MIPENFKYKANYYALILLAFVIPLERKLIAPVTILFLITCILNYKKPVLKASKKLFFSLLYIVYAIGLLYTENLEYGKKDLLTKLPLLLVPIGFYLSSLEIRAIRSKVFSSFVDGCIVSMGIALIHSGYQYFFTQDTGYFFYAYAGLFAHPSYLAMMFNMSIFLLYVSVLSPQKMTLNKSNLVHLILITCFSVYVFLLISKTGIITCVLIHLFAFVWWIIKSKNFVSAGIILGITLLLSTFAFKSSSALQNRFIELGTISTSQGEGKTSTSSRISIWGLSMELIGQQPILGYGTGDVKDVLIATYKQNEYDYLAEKKLNAHNQFLQTTLATGLVGGILLVLMFILPLLWGLKSKNYLLLFFLLLVLLNFTTESMLERQVGVIFYSLFIFLCLPPDQKPVKNDKN